MSSWTCSKCTFINPPQSHEPYCLVCSSTPPQSSSSSSPPSSPSSKPTWSCKSCTSLNPYTITNCKICGTRASASSPSSFEIEEDELGSSIGNVFLPLQRCRRKTMESFPIEASVNDSVDLGGFHGINSANKEVVKQVATKTFNYTKMDREFCIAEVVLQDTTPLVVATGHLESPCGWDLMCGEERVDQANEAVNTLKKNPNAIFCGDFNWNEKLDGPFLLPDGWDDAWTQLRPGENGWTYDAKSKYMLSGNLRLQLDRFVFSLRDFKLSGIEMVGLKRSRVYFISRRRK